MEICADAEGFRLYRADLDKGVSSEKDVALLFAEPHLRLDNRSSLLSSLQLSPLADDEAILISGWKRWGEGLADRLRGSFAFALYDASTASVYIARDIFGLSPLYYFADSRMLCVAGSSRRLRALLPDVPASYDLMIADFIHNSVQEHEATFFEGVLRLRPAHWMRVTRDGVQMTRYWSMGDVPRDQDGDDVPARFRELFTRSVQRCAEPGRTAILLSGGLDSSSIAALANARGMPAFAMTYPDTKGWCDGPHLSAIARSSGVSLHEFPSDTHNPLADMEFWLDVVDGPYLPRGFSVSNRLLPQIRSAGYDIVLSGHGGDEIVSYGYGRLNELARERKWMRLWKEMPENQGHTRVGRLRGFGYYLGHSSLVRRIYRKYRSVAQKAAVAHEPVRWLSDSFAASVPDGRYGARAAVQRLDHDERMLHEEVLQLPMQALSLELTALCSRAVGVTTRMPFYDRELLEFSLSLPSQWKLRKGMSRFVLREAVGEDLPTMIRRRSDKFNFAGNFTRGLVAHKDQVLDLTNPSGRNWAKLVNVPQLQHVRDQLSRDDTVMDIVNSSYLWKFAILTLWEDIARKPVDAAIVRPL